MYYTFKIYDATILEDCFSRFAEKLHTVVKCDHILADRCLKDVLHSLTETQQFIVQCPGLS